VKAAEAEGRLRELLVAAGVKAAAPPRRLRREHAPTREDLARTWSVYQQFAAEPVEDAEPREEDGDGILAQYGVYDWGQGEWYELDLTRQFTFADEDGEYSHMAQLQCTFRFAPTPELEAITPQNLWSFEMSLDDFFAQALAMPGFRVDSEPVALVISYGDV
jgi:hypothetical protein